MTEPAYSLYFIFEQGQNNGMWNTCGACGKQIEWCITSGEFKVEFSGKNQGTAFVQCKLLLLILNNTDIH